MLNGGRLSVQKNQRMRINVVEKREEPRKERKMMKRASEVGQYKRLDITVKCLGLYFAMMPFDSFPMFGMGSILKIVAMLPILSVWLIHKEFSVLKKDNVILVFLLFVFSCSITAIYTIDLSSTWYELKRLLLNSILILSVGGLHRSYSKYEIAFLEKSLVFGGIATIVMTLIFPDTSKGGRLTMAINGASQNQNYINGYILFAYAYMINQVIVHKKKLCVGICIGMLLFSLMTGSRGAVISLLVVTIAVFYFNMFKMGKVRYGTLLCVVSVVILGVIAYDYLLSLIPKEVAVRFTREYIANYKGTNRTQLWGNLVGIFSQASFTRKLFGFGYGTVAIVNNIDNLVAHNIWLEQMVSCGFIGLFVLVTMQVLFVKRTIKCRNAVVFSAYVGYLAMSMTHSLTNYKPIWNTVMMIMIISSLSTSTGVPEEYNG